MKWKYCCPHCKGVLNPHTKIILVARRGRRQGVVLLSPRPGNYTTIADDTFPLNRGEMASFFCPICGHDLVAPQKKLAELLLLLPGLKTKRIQFSRVYGEHATFILDGETLIPYGEDADLYGKINFFGV